MNNRRNLQSLSEARWYERSGCIQVCVHCSVLSWKTRTAKPDATCCPSNIAIHHSTSATEHALHSLLPLTTFLHTKQCNICQRGNHYNRPVAVGEGRPTSMECVSRHCCKSRKKIRLGRARLSAAVDRGAVLENMLVDKTDRPSQNWMNAMRCICRSWIICCGKWIQVNY